MSYVDAHPLTGAFVANKLDRLSDLIAGQGEYLLRDAGIDIPSRAVSLALLIGEQGQLSVADIASLLGQPHQLVTQRADVLTDLGLIERTGDPGDGRRKILVLTAKGEDQFAKLQIRLSEAADAFAGLFDEIQCDLSALVTKAMEALDRASVLDRIKLQSSQQAQMTDRLECQP